MKFIVRGAPIDLADELEAEFKRTARRAVKEGAEILLGAVRTELTKRSGPKPSPPGEPPAKQSGDLAKSWQAIPVRMRGRVASSGIESYDKGAARMEWGGVDSRGIRVLPRAYLDPAARKVEGRVTELLAETVR